MPENTLYYGDNLDILRRYIEVRYHRARMAVERRSAVSRSAIVGQALRQYLVE